MEKLEFDIDHICEWKENNPLGSVPNTFDGTCGIFWYIDAEIGDRLADHEINYCPKCGGKIIDIPYPKESEV